MKKISISIIIVIILIQFVPINRENPQTKQGSEIQLPKEVNQIIIRSCYDCHSNNTIWPWYSNVAPVSWFVANHVHEARKELNFSEWSTYSEKRMNHKLKGISEEVEENEMPLTSYLLMHEKANLSEKDKGLIINWAKSYYIAKVDSTKSEN